MLLADKVVMVTGAGSGIGRGICRALAAEGAAVAALDLDGKAAAGTADIVIDGGGQATALTGDVTDPASRLAAVDEVVNQLGSYDALVNNAGVLRMSSALETAAEDFALELAVNTQALLDCCRAAAGHWQARGRGGAIVNVASNAGKVGYPDMAAYNASKAAVISLTRTLSTEWAEHGINVNAVCPGGVATEMLRDVARWAGGRTGEDPEEVLATIVPRQLGRHIRPIEVGRVIAFLLSEQATIIRGQAINVDGGDTPY